MSAFLLDCKLLEGEGRPYSSLLMEELALVQCLAHKAHLNESS